MTYLRDGRRRRWAVPVIALAVALLAGSGPGSSPDDDHAAGAHSGHGGHGGHGSHNGGVRVAALPSKPSKPMTVQQLASGLGCDLNLAEGKRRGYRQASCEYNGNHTILLDFDSDEGMHVWLELSQHHSGVFYLVGERWILTVYTLNEVSPLQDQFGGKIEQGHHAPPPEAAPK